MLLIYTHYSPDGRYIISGSGARTIQIWDAETGDAVGKPLEGHTGWVWAVAYSHRGHLIGPFKSGMLRLVVWLVILYKVTGMRYYLLLTLSMASALPLDLLITLSVYGPHSHVFPPHSAPHVIRAMLIFEPDPDGWVRDSEDGLLYWVPPDCRTGLHSPSLSTIAVNSSVRLVSLDFEDFAFGRSWVQIFNSARP
jgi:hypothetical protein